SFGRRTRGRTVDADMSRLAAALAPRLRTRRLVRAGLERSLVRAAACAALAARAASGLGACRCERAAGADDDGVVARAWTVGATAHVAVEPARDRRTE